MKLIHLVLLAALAAPSLFAIPVLTLNTDGSAGCRAAGYETGCIDAGYGTPGAWGFSVFWLKGSDGIDAWFSINNVFFVEPTGVGEFHDLVSTKEDYAGYLVEPGTVWSPKFDISNPDKTAWTVLGWYEITDRDVSPPTMLYGDFYVFYTAYDGDPSKGGKMLDMGSSNPLIIPATVNVLDPVYAEVPEPATGLLALAGLAVAAGFRRFRA